MTNVFTGRNTSYRVCMEKCPEERTITCSLCLHMHLQPAVLLLGLLRQRWFIF